MLDFILGIIIISVLISGLIIFPYKKAVQALKKVTHMRTFCFGILLILFSSIAESGLFTAPSNNEPGNIFSQFVGGLHLIFIVVGVLCFVASFFIKRLKLGLNQ